MYLQEEESSVKCAVVERPFWEIGKEPYSYHTATMQLNTRDKVCIDKNILFMNFSVL